MPFLWSSQSFQPGGLRESSRWSQTTGTVELKNEHPEGMQEFVYFLAPLRGAINVRARSGGLRFAATSGYFLSTLRVAIMSSSDVRAGDFIVGPFVILGEEA